MAPTSRDVVGAGGGDGATTTDIAISAAVVVATLREESERFQCLAAAQMAIAESFAERARTCEALKDDVRIARIKKEAYEAAALRLQGIVDRVLGREAESSQQAKASAHKPTPQHPLVSHILNERLPPMKRYEAFVQLAYVKENVPADLQTLRDVYVNLIKVLPSFDDVLEVEPIGGLDEVKAWALYGKTGEDLNTMSHLTQAALGAIGGGAYATNQQPLVEAAIVEIRRLGNDLAVRKMLG